MTVTVYSSYFCPVLRFATESWLSDGSSFPIDSLAFQEMKALGDVTIVDLEEKTLLGSHDDTAELPSDVSIVSVNSYLSFSLLFISKRLSLLCIFTHVFPLQVLNFLKSQLKSGLNLDDSLSRAFLRANIMLFGGYRVGFTRNEETHVSSLQCFF